MSNTLQTNESGALELFREGKPSYCPFHPPMQIAGKLQGQVNLIYKNCNSDCTMFQIERNPVSPDKKIDSIVLNCGSGSKYSIDKVEAVNKNALKLV
jgi:hypothetical protein